MIIVVTHTILRPPGRRPRPPRSRSPYDITRTLHYIDLIYTLHHITLILFTRTLHYIDLIYIHHVTLRGLLPRDLTLHYDD